MMTYKAKGREYSGFQVTGMIEWGKKSKPKIIPRASNKTQNPWYKNLRPQALKKAANKFGCTLFAELRGPRGHYHESSDCLKTPLKNPFLDQATQKILAKFSYPKKSFDHPSHLKSGVPPPPRSTSAAHTLHCSNVKVHFICGNGCQWYVWCRKGWPDKCAGPLAPVHALYG